MFLRFFVEHACTMFDSAVLNLEPFVPLSTKNAYICNEINPETNQTCEKSFF